MSVFVDRGCRFSVISVATSPVFRVAVLRSCFSGGSGVEGGDADEVVDGGSHLEP